MSFKILWRPFRQPSLFPLLVSAVLDTFLVTEPGPLDSQRQVELEWGGC